MIVVFRKVSDGVEKVSDSVRRRSVDVRKVSEGARKVLDGFRKLSGRCQKTVRWCQKGGLLTSISHLVFSQGLIYIGASYQEWRNLNKFWKKKKNFLRKSYF